MSEHHSPNSELHSPSMDTGDYYMTSPTSPYDNVTSPESGDGAGQTQESNQFVLGYPPLMERHRWMSAIGIFVTILLFIVVVRKSGILSGLGFGIATGGIYWVLMQVFATVFSACNLPVDETSSPPTIGSVCKSSKAEKEIQMARDGFYISFTISVIIFFAIFMKPRASTEIVRKRSSSKRTSRRRSSKKSKGQKK